MSKRTRTLSDNHQRDLSDRRAAARKAAIATGGLSAYRMAGKTIPDKRKQASKDACRGRFDA
jgi:hypothetical protein